MLQIKRIKIKGEGWYNYHFKDEKNQLSIIFGGNGDLYFCSKNYQNQEAEFIITKENIFIYNLFNQLFNDFKNAEIYQIDELEMKFIIDKNDKNIIREKTKQRKQWNEELKNSYLYKKLVNNEIITWISDDSLSFDIKTADAMRIIKEQEQYRLSFNYYEDEFPHTRAIRIRNSGSRYAPFNIPMMKFFNKLQEYDPNYHQIHIEEYLYKKAKSLKK